MAKEQLPRGITAAYRQRAGRQIKLYQVRVTWQGRRELVGRFETLRDAKHALVLAQADMLRGTFIPPRAVRASIREEQQAIIDAHLNRKTVAEVADEWLVHLRRLGRKPSTLYTYERHLQARILPHFGSYAVESVTPEEVQAWFDKLDAEEGRGVSRPLYMTLSYVFGYAAGTAKSLPSGFEPVIDRSPCQIPGVASTKPTRPLVSDEKVLSQQQIAAIAEHMPRGEELAVLVAGYLALRIGEVLGLQRRDVTFDARGGAWLQVARQVQSRGAGLRIDTPKTEAGERELPIPPALVDSFRSHLAAFVAEQSDALLFPRTRLGTIPLHPNVLRAHFRSAITLANAMLTKQKQPTIPSNFVFHGLRHSALTHLGQSMATQKELMAWAGHRDPETVQRYQHAERNRMADLAAKQPIVLPSPKG